MSSVPTATVRVAQTLSQALQGVARPLFLEFAPGYFQSTKAVLKCFPRCRILAIDQSALVRLRGLRYWPRVRILQHTLSQQPLPVDGRFHAAFGTEFMEMLDDKTIDQMCKDSARLLPPGSPIVLTAFDRYFYRQLLTITGKWSVSGPTAIHPIDVLQGLRRRGQKVNRLRDVGLSETMSFYIRPPEWYAARFEDNGFGSVKLWKVVEEDREFGETITHIISARKA